MHARPLPCQSTDVWYNTERHFRVTANLYLIDITHCLNFSYYHVLLSLEIFLLPFESRPTPTLSINLHYAFNTRPNVCWVGTYEWLSAWKEGAIRQESQSKRGNQFHKCRKCIFNTRAQIMSRNLNLVIVSHARCPCRLCEKPCEPPLFLIDKRALLTRTSSILMGRNAHIMKVLLGQNVCGRQWRYTLMTASILSCPLLLNMWHLQPVLRGWMRSLLWILQMKEKGSCLEGQYMGASMPTWQQNQGRWRDTSASMWVLIQQ